MTKLYHASPSPIESNVLHPGTRNVVVEEGIHGPRARQVYYDEVNPPYLYASDARQFSLTYTVTKGIRLGNMTAHSGVELLFLDQESKIGDPELKGGIYSFQSDGFIQIFNKDGPTSQWVSPDPFHLHNAEFTPVRSFNDLMREGVQIYQVADNAGYCTDDFYRDISFCDAQFLRTLQTLVQSGKVRWMNEERSINPIDGLNRDKKAVKPDGIHLSPGPAP